MNRHDYCDDLGHFVKEMPISSIFIQDLIITGRVSTANISEISVIYAHGDRLIHEYFLERGHPRKEVQ